jgi:hypothetical protein
LVQNGNAQAMAETTVDALIVDLLLWLQSRDRTYEEVIDVWRTSCPKLPVWEDANDRMLIAREYVNGREMVKITPKGIVFLNRRKASSQNHQSTRHSGTS